MALTATYVSTTSFTVVGDKRSDFIPGRSVYCDCGEDGVKYGYVAYSSYSSPDTTVVLDSADSQALTSNLASALFSRFKLERIGGNNPLELLWMSRGQQTIAVMYKDADEIALKPGVVHINDGTTEAVYHCPGFDKQLTGLSASTWYYVYAKAPTSGRVLSAAEIEYDTTSPSLTSAKQGYYHPTNTGWRCIGFILTTAVSAIIPFTTQGGEMRWTDSDFAEVSGTAYSNATFTDITLTNSPLGDLVVLAEIYVSDSANWYFRTNGSTGTGIRAASLTHYTPIAVKTDASKVIEVKPTTNNATLYFVVLGYVLPMEIFSAGAGGGASSFPLFNTASRGLQSIEIAYKDADEIYLNPGAIHIWGSAKEGLYQVATQVTKQLTSLSASTWYAIYVQAPASGDQITSTEITYSSTMPTQSLGKQGWYDSTGEKRCIGFFHSSSGSAVAKFSVAGDQYVLGPENQIVAVNGTTPSNTWTDAAIPVPLANMVAILKFAGIYVNAAVAAQIRPDGSSDAGHSIFGLGAQASPMFAMKNVDVGATKIIEYRYASATTNQFYIELGGFLLPAGFFTGPAGCITRSIQTSFDLSKRGMKTGLDLAYKDADEFYVGGGVIHINDGSNDLVLEVPSLITKQVTGLSAATWYAVYVDPPDSGTTVQAADIEYSSTMPGFSHARAGWYHPTNNDWRCIGFVRTDGSSNLVHFLYSGRKYIISNYFPDVSAVAPSTTWTTGTLTLPIGDMIGICTVTALYINAESGISVRRKGAATHYGLVTASAACLWNATEALISTDGNKQFEFSYSVATTNQAFFFTHGFIMPDKM